MVRTDRCGFRWQLPVLVALAAVVLLAGRVYANSMSPILIPGFSTSSAGWGFVILATLLAAFIEVPYVSKAGLCERVWRHTLLANVISTAVGILFPAYSYLDHNLLIGAAVVMSVVVEGVYLSRKAARLLNWGWLVAGNATSAVVLLWLSSIWAVSMDRAPDSLRDLGASVQYSWYRQENLVGCVNSDLVDDARVKQWVPDLKALRVRNLDLRGSRVTDDGITALADVPTLTHVNLTETQVTENGIEALQRALPRVVVYPIKSERLRMKLQAENKVGTTKSATSP